MMLTNFVNYSTAGVFPLRSMEPYRRQHQAQMHYFGALNVPLALRRNERKGHDVINSRRTECPLLQYMKLITDPRSLLEL